MLSGFQIAKALPNVSILGNYAVVGTGLSATTSANGNFTASGTIVLPTLSSGGSPCLVVSSNGTISTSSCGAVTTSTFSAVTPIAYNANTATFSFSGVFASGTSGSDFSIASSSGTWTWNIPSATGTARGLLTANEWSRFNDAAVASPNKASSSITISAGSGLAGGGDLTANRTLYFAGTFATGTSGNAPNIASSSPTWTFNFPTATSTATGTLSSSEWSRFNAGIAKNFTLTVPAPTSTATDNITNHVTIKHFDSAFTINKVSCINVATSSNVTFQMRHSATRRDGGGATALFSAAQECTNTTSSVEFETFNDNSLAADEMLWVDFTAASSSQVSFSIFGRFDP